MALPEKHLEYFVNSKVTIEKRPQNVFDIGGIFSKKQQKITLINNF